MNICFILDPWETLVPEKDSSLRMIHEAVSRKHIVGLLYPKNITVVDNVTYGDCHVFNPVEKVHERLPTFHQRSKLTRKRLPLKGFDTIVLRKNPPLDLLMLNFLDSVKDDTLIVNSIEGLRMANKTHGLEHRVYPLFSIFNPQMKNSKDLFEQIRPNQVGHSNR